MNVAPNNVSGGSADPVALHRLQRVAPVQAVEVVEQPFGVRRDAQHPLAHGPLEHGVVAAVAAALRCDLLVGQHGAQPGTPVHRRLGDLGEALAVDDVGPLTRRQPRPSAAVVQRPRPRLELGDQLGDRPRPADAPVRSRRVGVVPRVEDAGEDPLGPAVVARVGGLDRAAAVVAQADPAELAAVRGDVLGRGDGGVLAGLHGVLLGR